MFGYVRPVLNRLDEGQRDAYQSAYCGLCHAMGRRFGRLARFTLNYDFTFLAILLSGARGEEDACDLRCPAHPLRSPRRCHRGAALDVAADESMILTWYKLRDDVADRGAVAALPYRGACRALRRAYGRAADAMPEFDRRVRDGMERLTRLEEERSDKLDRVADAFAGILAAAADAQLPQPAQRRAMEQLLYHLGRWIYLVDAWDDLDEDRKAGRYNPLDARFCGRAREERAYVETTLTHSLRLVGSAASLLSFGGWAPVVENILYSGLPAVQSAVLDGRWRELRKQKVGRNTDERSV